MTQLGNLISCFALPLVLEQTAVPIKIEPITTEFPMQFSHDSKLFDAKNSSIQESSNENVPKPESSNAINRIVKVGKVLPMQNERQQRIHVFRPLFVYRQEQQAMKKRATARPSIDPDRQFLYPPFPYDPYYYYHHHHPDHHYANNYYHDDYYYDPYAYPYPSDDYITNDLLHGAPDYWYPYH